jgi:MFS family permease
VPEGAAIDAPAAAGGPPGAPPGTRAAVLVVFFGHALLFASWTAHIPQVKSHLGLTDARLGLALFGAPIGSLAAMLLTGRLLVRFGSRRMVQATLLGYCLTGVGVGLATTQLELFGALAVWGVFQGSLDVSMNTQAIIVERALGRPVMSGFHGAWSTGGFAGAGLGALAVARGLSLGGQLVILGLVAALVAGAASTQMLPDPPPPTAPRLEAPDRRRPFGVLRNPVVLVLGAVALACMLCEGAAADWSAVYLHDSLRTTPAVAGLGYAAFSAAMVALRLTGDRLLVRVARRTLLPALAAGATVGFAAALLVRTPLAGLLGFACLGVGVALVVPSAMSAAGRLPGVHAGTAVAAVSAIGWIGFVGGPPLIGHLAQAISLPTTLALLPVLTAVIAVAIRTTRAFGSTDAAAGP